MASSQTKFTSANPTIKSVQKTIKHLLDKYLISEQEKDVSVTGIINWFSHKGRGGGGDSPFDDKGLIDRKEFYEVWKKMLEQVEQGDDAKAYGQAHDAAILSIANDLVAQIEMAANFRRTKVAHHFAKSRYNLVDVIGKGGRDGSKSILEAYTTVFLDDAINYVKTGHGTGDSSAGVKQ